MTIFPGLAEDWEEIRAAIEHAWREQVRIRNL